jgi:transcriptional regulator with XRE-family HTH domain
MKKVRIGSYLRYHRERRDLTQADVANVLNYSQQTIAKWENSTSTPDPISLCNLADLYQVSLDELLGHTIVKENETPYYTKKDVIEDWIHSTGFKTVFELRELDSNQLKHLTNLVLSTIELFKGSVNIPDSEQ